MRYRHDWPVLGARDVCRTDTISGDDVVIVHAPVVADPFREPVSTSTLVGIVAACVHLVRRVSRHLEVMIDKPRALPQPRSGERVRHRVVASCRLSKAHGMTRRRESRS